MSRIFLTSDHHFGHSNIINFESRPFKNVDEMNNIMIKKWNSVVGKNDIVYHAGDFSFVNKEKTKEILNQLQGRKRLIMGNHDRSRSRKWWKEIGFEDVYEFPICISDFYWVSHEPMYLNSSMPYINLHGHIHSQKYKGDNYINLCVEHWDYTPVLFDEIKTLIVNNYFYEREEQILPTIKQDIDFCDQCPYATVTKVWTPDSWDNIRSVHCTKLKKDVHEYLDWNEKATIPEECPFN